MQQTAPRPQVLASVGCPAAMNVKFEYTDTQTDKHADRKAHVLIGSRADRKTYIHTHLQKRSSTHRYSFPLYETIRARAHFSSGMESLTVART